MAPRDYHTEAGRPAERSGEAAGAGILGFLRDDHRKLLELFKRTEGLGTRDLDTLLTLFTRIEEGLKLHMEGEERFFYTMLEGHDAAGELVLESFEEHYLVKMLIAAFTAMALDDHRWGAKFRVLRRLAERHMEREELELFPVAARVLTRDQLNAAAELYLGLKDGEKGLPV
jgi:hemerythrin-like domain-containing protein